MATQPVYAADLHEQARAASPERVAVEGTARLILVCLAKSGKTGLDTEMLSPLHICLLRVARGCRAELIEQTFGVRLVGQPDPVLGLRVEQVAPAIALARSIGWLAPSHGHHLRLTAVGHERVEVTLGAMPVPVAMAVRDAANAWRQGR